MIARVALLIAFALGACDRAPAAVRVEPGPESEDELLERVRAIDPQEPSARSSRATSRVVAYSVAESTATIVRGLCSGLFALEALPDLAEATWSPDDGLEYEFGCGGFLGTSPRVRVHVRALDRARADPAQHGPILITARALTRDGAASAAVWIAGRLGADTSGGPPFRLPEGHLIGPEPVLGADEFEATLIVRDPPARLADVVLR